MLSKGWQRLLVVSAVPLLLFVAAVTYKDAKHSCDLDMSLRLDDLVLEQIANDPDKKSRWDREVGRKPMGSSFIAHYNNVVSAGVLFYEMEGLLHKVQLEAKNGSLCDGKVLNSLADSAKGIAILTAYLLAAIAALIGLVKVFSWVKDGFRK